MTEDTVKLETMEELLEHRRHYVAVFTKAQDERAERLGPLTLKYHLDVIRDDATALIARLDRLELALEKTGADISQVDL